METVNVQIGVWLPMGLKMRLEREAESQSRSMSNYVRHLLAKKLEEQPGQDPVRAYKRRSD